MSRFTFSLAVCIPTLVLNLSVTAASNSAPDKKFTTLSAALQSFINPSALTGLTDPTLPTQYRDNNHLDSAGTLAAHNTPAATNGGAAKMLAAARLLQKDSAQKKIQL